MVFHFDRGFYDDLTLPELVKWRERAARRAGAEED